MIQPIQYIKEPNIDKPIPPLNTSHKEIIDQQIEIEWIHKCYNFIKNRVEYSGGVKLYYKDFLITAENAWVDLDNKIAQARDQVAIYHLNGCVHADSIQWDYSKISGNNVVFSVCGIEGKCKSYLSDKEKIVLRNFQLDFMPKRIITVKSPYCRIEKKNIFIKKPNINIGWISFKLDEKEIKSQGTNFKFVLPQIKTRHSKLGISYSPSLQLTDEVLLIGNIQSSSWQPLGLSAAVSFKLNSEGPFTGPSELEDPFFSSCLDNLNIENHAEEIESLQANRWNLRLMSGQNLEVMRTLDDSKKIYTTIKPYDIQMDIGGIQNAPLNLQLQLQSIKEKGESLFTKRGIIRVQTIPFIHRINDNTDIALRVDGRYNYSRCHLRGAGWLRGLGSIQTDINSKWSIGLGVSFGKQLGIPHFEFDNPWSLNDIHFRLSCNEEKYSISYLTHYSYNNNRWYDHQLKIGFLWGAFEPYILYKSNPGSYNIGLNLRISKLFNQLK